MVSKDEQHTILSPDIYVDLWGKSLVSLTSASAREGSPAVYYLAKTLLSQSPICL